MQRFFAIHEFSGAEMLCASDLESLTMAEILAAADEGTLALWNNLSLSYTEAQGLPILRQEIAR